MALGIDQQIQDRANAYRENPAALEKNYSINKDLLDLLALQKIKSEKDAAARELQLSQQQVPQTIAQQRGKEAVDRTKGDLTNQVSGVLKQKQARQQQNMQRAAAAPPAGAPPAGRHPVNRQMAGVAGQPAPNMARMAHGGIVAFRAGKEVSVTDNQLKRMGLTRNQWENTLTDAGRKIYLRKFPALPAEASMARRFITGIGDFFDRPVAKEGAARKAQGYFGGARQIGAAFAPYSQGQQTLADLEAKQKKAEAIRNLANQSPPAQTVVPVGTTLASQTGGFGALDAKAQGLEPSVAPRSDTRGSLESPVKAPLTAAINKPFSGTPLIPIDASGIASAFPVSARTAPTLKARTLQDVDPTTATRLSSEMGDITALAKKLSTADPIAARNEAFTWAKQAQDASGVAGAYDDMLTKRAALDAATKAQREKYGWLPSNIGPYGLASLGKAYGRQREAWTKQDYERLAAEENLRKAGISAQQTISGKAIDTGMTTYGEVTKSVNDNIKTRRAIVETDQKRLSELAQRMLQTDIANLEHHDRQVKLEHDKFAKLLDANTKIKVGNLTAQLAHERNQIAAMNVQAMSESDANKAIVQIEKSVADVKVKFAAILQEAISALVFDPKWGNLTRTEQENKKNVLRAASKDMVDLHVRQMRNAIRQKKAELSGYKVTIPAP